MHLPSILWVSPHDVERKLLAYVLQREGFSVSEAASADGIAEQAKALSTDLIILDSSYYRPGKPDAPTALKANADTGTIPIVLFGDPLNQADAEGARNAGVAAWVMRKGFEINSLLDKMKGILDQPRPIPLHTKPQNASSPDATPKKELNELSSSKIGNVLSDLGGLPAFEFNITEAITTACTQENAGDHIAKLVLRDPVLMAALLATANASESGGPDHPIVDPREAFDAIGAKQFYIVAESVAQLDDRNATGWSPGRFWVHSAATAMIAGFLSKRLQLGVPAEAMTAGLLHDVGYAILAHHFPKHLAAVVQSATSCLDTITQGEKEAVGAHHGQIGDFALRKLKIPESLRSVVLVHHDPPSSRQRLPASSRITAMLVQAADRIADALFPGDPPLTSLDALPDLCVAAMREADIELSEIIDSARRIVIDLLTEMVHLFPNRGRSPSHYAERPIDRMLYYAPESDEYDLVRIFFEVRATQVQTVEQVGSQIGSDSRPFVVNLLNVPELPHQIQILTSLMAGGHMRDRKGLILITGKVSHAHQAIASACWKIASVPTSPAAWMPWLAEPAEANAEVELDACVA